MKEMSKDETDKRGKYKQYTERDRLTIARYAELNGPRRTARKFDKQYPNLNESTVRSFLKKYTAMKSRGKKNSTSPIKGIPAKRRGRPLMLRIVDKKIRDFLIALRHRGGVVKSTIAIAAAKRLIQSSSDPDLKRIKINNQMGFVRRMVTTAKIPVPDKPRKEIKLVFMHKIVQKVEKHNILHSLIINADETPSKYVPLGRSTLAEKNVKDLPISGHVVKDRSLQLLLQLWMALPGLFN